MAKAEESPEFRIFWEEVWRKHARHTDGRGLAREKFNRIVKDGADPQDIIDGSKWFFLTMKERDREFVPLSATWLARGAFEDLAEQYRAHEARRQARLAAKSDNVVSISSNPEMAARARALVGGVLREA